MMTPAFYVSMIDMALREIADASQSPIMEAYLLNQFTCLGIRAPIRRAAIKSLPKKKWTSAQNVIEIAQFLWQKPEREFRYTAIDVLKDHVSLIDVVHIPELLQLLQQDAWWETVDGMTSVIGQALLLHRRRGGVHGQDACDEWVNHPNLWVRRCAMLHQLGWRLKTDTSRLQLYSELLSSEKEFFIRKAIGWALRDYARWNPEWVKGFIQDKGTLFSRLTVREAAKHMDRTILLLD